MSYQTYPFNLTGIKNAIFCHENVPIWRETLQQLQDEEKEFDKNPATFRSNILAFTSKSNYVRDIKAYTRDIKQGSKDLENADKYLSEVLNGFKKRDELFINRKLVLASAHHPRLGEKSPCLNFGIQNLDEDTLRLIADMLDPGPSRQFFGLTPAECEEWLEFARMRGLTD